jgi:outer membrane receptor protein involved in Fe transport
LKNIMLQLNIKNLLDKHYYTYYYSAENPAEGNIYGVEPIFSNGLVAAPRTLMGEISLHF